VLPNRASMKGVRVDCATATISGKELREGCMEVVGNEGGDDVLFAIWNDKEVASTGSIEIVLPSRTWVNFWLGTIRTGSAFFCISIHSLSFQHVSLGLLI